MRTGYVFRDFGCPAVLPEVLVAVDIVDDDVKAANHDSYEGHHEHNHNQARTAHFSGSALCSTQRRRKELTPALAQAS